MPVPGQFVAGQFVGDNSSRTIRSGQLVAKYKIIFIESTASTSATLFSSLPLPNQLYFLSHSCFHSATLLHHSRFHFRNIPLINTASISATLFSSLPLLFQLHFFHHSRFHFSNILLINPASISATLSCLQIYLLQDFIVCL